MTQIHEPDQPFRPDMKQTVQNEDRDATFALDADDPSRVKNRGGLQAVFDGDNNGTDPQTQSEYSSDPIETQNGMDDEEDSDDVIDDEDEDLNGIIDDGDEDLDDDINDDDDEDLEGIIDDDDEDMLDEEESTSSSIENDADLIDGLEAEMDDEIEDEEAEMDDYPQRSEGSQD